MLHMILTILKIIGICLLVLLALLLAAVILVLFVPVRYCITAGKYEEINAEVKVTWLLHLVSVRFGYEKGTYQQSVRILGIRLKGKQPKESGEDVFTSGEWEALEQEDASAPEEAVSEAAGMAEHAAEKAADKVEAAEEKISETAEALQEEEANMQDAAFTQEEKAGKSPPLLKRLRLVISGLFKKLADFFRGLYQALTGVSDAVKRVQASLSRLADTIGYYRALWRDERTRRAISLCVTHLVKLLKHINPKKSRIYLHFGFEDPASTGQALAVLGIVYPFLGPVLQVAPSFEQPVLEGDIFLKGRMRVAVFLRSGWVLFFNKDLRYLIKALKKEEQ